MKRTVIVICALISLGVAGPAFAGSKTTLAQSGVAQRPHHEIGEAVPKPAGPLGSPTQTPQYAAREQAAPELTSFEGGHNGGLYIGGSTLAVVLLIVLLIVLI